MTSKSTERKKYVLEFENFNDRWKFRNVPISNSNEIFIFLSCWRRVEFWYFFPPPREVDSGRLDGWQIDIATFIKALIQIVREIERIFFCWYRRFLISSEFYIILFNLYLLSVFCVQNSWMRRTFNERREKRRKIMFSSSFIRFIAHSLNWKKSMNVARDEENWVAAAAKKLFSAFSFCFSL